MDQATADVLKRMQLEVEALAELAAGNPSASRSFGRWRQEIRDIMKEQGHGIDVAPDPGLEMALRVAAAQEQDRRLSR